MGKEKGRKKVSIWGCQKRQAKETHSSCLAGSSDEDGPLPERGAPVPRFLGTRKLGLAGPLFYRLICSVRREILVFILRPTFSALFQAIPPPSHLPSAVHVGTHSPGYLTILLHHSSGGTVPPLQDQEEEVLCRPARSRGLFDYSSVPAALPISLFRQ